MELTGSFIDGFVQQKGELGRRYGEFDLSHYSACQLSIFAALAEDVSRALPPCTVVLFKGADNSQYGLVCE
jgi:hypothetical protein